MPPNLSFNWRIVFSGVAQTLGVRESVESVRPAPRLVFRIVWLVLAVIGCCVLIVLSVQGYGNSMRNASSLHSLPQYAMTASQFLYSALGPIVVVLRFASVRWLYAAWRAWVFSFTVAVALIPWAWIAPSYVSTLGFAVVGLVCAGLIGFLVLSGVHSRPRLNEATSDA